MKVEKIFNKFGSVWAVVKDGKVLYQSFFKLDCEQFIFARRMMYQENHA